MSAGGARDDEARRRAFARSARRWMHAYPRRWRDVRGDELLGVLEDVAAEGAAAGGGRFPRRLPAREAAALVRAGWALRWRERPPWYLWLAYRALDRRLPERYLWWVVDDIRGPLYLWRRLSLAVASGALTYAALSVAGVLVRGFSWGTVAAMLAGFLVMSVLTRGYHRRTAMQRHVYDHPAAAGARPGAGGRADPPPSSR
ncbi:hypothetical protein DNL40_08360 [Xylanimonas oleitrophica]|uniref:Uncharacterized protein n=1 Tax=Xylanimonas oleitrophica TaxID=2607479 RepID=A0A2W5WS88_9MICO|nr:hypothetical protein [Xylanimonas oleitrophica]PZR53503.1 hypothetical protein DNL40_08360 [Xylanimonas oleitrophica]